MAKTVKLADGTVTEAIALLNADGTLAAMGAGGGASALTDAQLRASAVPVSLSTLPEIEIKNDAGNPIPVNLASSIFAYSANSSTNGNSSPVSVAPLGFWQSLIDNVINRPNAIISVIADQNVKLAIYQYLDPAGTSQVVAPIVTTITTGRHSVNVPILGGYFQIRVDNLSSTTAANVTVDTHFGNQTPAPVLTQAGNMPVAIAEGTALVKGANDKWRDSFVIDQASLWRRTVDAGDGYGIYGNAQGSSWGQLSKSSLTNNTRSKILGKSVFKAPLRLGFGFSLSQRIHGEIFTYEMCSSDAFGNELINSGETQNIVDKQTAITTNVSVTSSVMTIYFAANHPFVYDDLVVLWGAADTRINIVARVQSVINKRCIQVPLAIGNGTYTVGASCFIGRVNLAAGNPDVMGLAMYDTASTNAAYFHRAQGSAILLSALSYFGASFTDALIPSSQAFAYNFQPRYNTELVLAMDTIRFGATSSDSGAPGSWYKRSQDTPDTSANYINRIQAITLPNKAAPLEIASAVKTGTSTATVTTVNPHGLQTGAYVRIYGCRDQANWPNLTTETVITVTGTNTFTLAWGAGVTATVYGGFAIAVNGTGSVTGAANLAVYGACWANGRLFLGTNATPSLSIGDTVRLVGLRDTTGAAYSNMSGRFKVAGFNPNVNETAIAASARTALASPTVTTTDTSAMPLGAIITGPNIPASTTIAGITAGTSITLSANATAAGSTWVNIIGMVLEPLDFSAPADYQPTVRLSGGGIVKETDLRLNFVRCMDYTRTPVELTGGHNTADAALGVGVNVNNSISATVTQGTAAALGTNGAGAWTVRNGAARTVDIALAAINATSTGAAIDVTANSGGQQFTFDVTAVSGTTPRMYPRIQESFDGGANFVTVFDMPPVVNSTDKTFVTPPLPVLGTHYRSIRTVTGTTPSFTNSVTRTSRPMESPPNRRQLVDRVLTLTAAAGTASTDYLYVEGCRKGQIVLALPAGVTTNPAVKLQVCDDIQAGAWYDVTGATVTGAVSAVVASVIYDMPPAKFARLVVTTAGAGITADTYTLMIKAWE